MIIIAAFQIFELKFVRIHIFDVSIKIDMISIVQSVELPIQKGGKN